VASLTDALSRDVYQSPGVFVRTDRYHLFYAHSLGLSIRTLSQKAASSPELLIIEEDTHPVILGGARNPAGRAG
jgi:hypothetical protein